MILTALGVAVLGMPVIVVAGLAGLRGGGGDGGRCVSGAGRRLLTVLVLLLDPSWWTRLAGLLRSTTVGPEPTSLTALSREGWKPGT